MPHPISYDGTQDDDQIRAVDLVHIEPSIREGVHLVSSLYGPLASAPIYRYPPVNIVPPYITGDPAIPNILTCEDGQWDASPSVTLAYQWMANGIDIPGATSKTWLSEAAYDGQFITCEVRGYNSEGEQYVLTSNSIQISLTIPLEIQEKEDYVITGVQAEQNITLLDEDTMIASGISALNRFDLQRQVAYFSTGMAALNRHDQNAMSTSVITGVGQEAALSILDAQVSIAVISSDEGVPFVSGVPQPMNVKNPGAEVGMAGWETFGNVDFEGNHGGINYVASERVHTGSLHFFGGLNAAAELDNFPYSYMWQDVDIWPLHVTDVDAGNCSVEITWYQYSLENQDQANIRLEYYSGADVLLGSSSGASLFSTPLGINFFREFTDSIPVNTRYIRIIPEFQLQAGNDIDAGIDTITMRIYTGTRNRDRSFGPSFEQWRLRFTQANASPGGSLSELEFRNTPGSLDITAGGTPIYGSVGYGATNADEAFDNLRNSGYWAGAQNSIALGTSWIGYDFGTPVNPGEIDITAREGSYALEVPKAFVVEGSDDGIRWTAVHAVDDEMHTGGTNYNTSERKQVIIPKGSFDFQRNTVGTGVPAYVRNADNTDDIFDKGNVYECLSRINITNLSVYLNDTTGAAFDYRLQLYRLNSQKSSLNGFGMVSEDVLEDISAVAPNLGSPVWVDHACVSGPHEFEVGDFFLVRFVDEDAATNSEDANEGRTYYHSDWNGPNTKLLRRVAKFVTRFENNPKTVLEIGDVDNRSASNPDREYAVDFSGTVF